MENLKWYFTGCLLILISTSLFAQESTSAKPFDEVTLNQWMEEVSNWGRWGAEDQLGTLNLITPEVRLDAVKLAREGITVSLALDMDVDSSLNNTRPLDHTFVRSGQWTMDIYRIHYHGYAHSHIDAQKHIALDGKIYNGYPEESIDNNVSENMGVHHMKNGIISRGLLVDIPRLKGVPYLEPGTAITIEDLNAWEKETGIKVRKGDVLLIRTGRWAYQDANGIWSFVDSAAGLHASTAKWLKEREIAVLGSDGTGDVLPSGIESQTHPMHQLVLISMGMPLLDNLNLEDLAEVAEQQNRWEFLLVVAPLRIIGGTGSPLNPIAIF